GTGAIGSFYGSRLHQPKNQVFVSFICRSNYSQVSKFGLKFETHTFGSYHLIPHQVFNSIQSAASQGPTGSQRGWDFIILCTKALPDQVDDSELLSPLFSNTTSSVVSPTLLLIQNGLGFEDLHRRRYPHVPLLSAVTVVNAEQLEPGLIRQNRWTRISIGPYVDFDYLHPTKPSTQTQLASICNEKINILVTLFKQGNILDAMAYSQRDLQLLRWHKLAINASMNPSSVLSGGLTNPQMVSDPILRTHLIGCMNEIFNATFKIFDISSFPSHFATIDQILRSIERAKDGSGAIKPSMLVDWEHHKPLELEVILGIPIKIATRAGARMDRLQSMHAFLINLQATRKRNPDRRLLAKV
ncbi:hypothetical protein O181_109466, partial [Austropuccinia psidii MF-1]|nr:hypothetical protein [Austropuccinia psidii MF-1]